MDEKIKKLRNFIEESENIVFFGGAGVSTESGVPDFRSKDGLYNQHDVQFEKYRPEYLLSHSCLVYEPEAVKHFKGVVWEVDVKAAVLVDGHKDLGGGYYSFPFCS